MIRRFLSSPINLSIDLPLRQTVWIKLDTIFAHYDLACQGLGAMLDVDGLRNVSVRIGAVVLGLGFGTFRRSDPTSGGC